MNPKIFSAIRPLPILGCGVLLTSSALDAQVTVDGNATSGEGYQVTSAQSQGSNLDNSNVLASLRTKTAPNRLNLAICGSANNNAILLFIDAKPGGVSRITPDLIDTQPGGEHEHINLLALDETTGLTFENGFEPEMAIRIYGDEVDVAGTVVKNAYVNTYDFLNHTQSYLGNSHAATVSGGPIRELRTQWQNVGNGSGTNGYATHPLGVEMDLNLSALGVIGNGQTVKLCAILVSKVQEYEWDPGVRLIEGCNQGLAPFVSTDNSLFSAINQFDFQAEPGTQTLSLTVDGLDPAGDEDSDNLLNGVETNTGVFIDANNTGTNPLVADTDGDGHQDGAEVNGTSGLGYVSDPTIPNYANLAVPGSFNLPSPWTFNTATNNPTTEMVRESTTLTGQYRWSLDYRFTKDQLGGFAYKFNSGYSTAIQWGAGLTPGVAVFATGNDIPGTITASGIHRFTFDQKTLAYTFGRVVFPDAGAFLAGYGLTAGGDADGDGLPNQAEFTANTDPTNPDTDGDFFRDSQDASPLVPAPPGSGYADWAASVIIGDSSRSADPDMDGLSNFQEYLFGSSPNQPSGSPVTIEIAGANVLLRWLERDNLADYKVHSSTILAPGPWPVEPATIIDDPAQPESKPGGYTLRRATLPATESRRFYQVSGKD